MRVAVEIRSAFDLAVVWNSMRTPQWCRTPESCEVVFQRGGYDIETLYWAGPMEEARELARKVASKGGADTFRIIEFTGTGAPLMPAVTFR